MDNHFDQVDLSVQAEEEQEEYETFSEELTSSKEEELAQQ